MKRTTATGTTRVAVTRQHATWVPDGQPDTSGYHQCSLLPGTRIPLDSTLQVAGVIMMKH